MSIAIVNNSPVLVIGGSDGGSNAATKFNTSFTNDDLTAGILNVDHALASKYVVVSVYNDSDEMVIPDEVILLNSNALQIDLTAFGAITGTWNVVVI